MQYLFTVGRRDHEVMGRPAAQIKAYRLIAGIAQRQLDPQRGLGAVSGASAQRAPPIPSSLTWLSRVVQAQGWSTSLSALNPIHPVWFRWETFRAPIMAMADRADVEVLDAKRGVLKGMVETGEAPTHDSLPFLC